MDTKTYLKQIGRLNRMIQNKIEEVKQLYSMATSITIEPKEVNIQVSGDKDRLGTAVAKIVDLETETNLMIDEYIKRRSEIVQQIDTMEDTNIYQVLSGKFIAGKTLEEIAVEMNYSFRQTKRIYGKAIIAFEKRYGELYINL